MSGRAAAANGDAAEAAEPAGEEKKKKKKKKDMDKLFAALEGADAAAEEPAEEPAEVSSSCKKKWHPQDNAAKQVGLLLAATAVVAPAAWLACWWCILARVCLRVPGGRSRPAGRAPTFRLCSIGSEDGRSTPV